MAPPPPQKTASRVTRPAARYRPGKAPLGASIDDYSDSDESDSGHHNHAAQQNDAHTGPTDLSSGTAALLSAQQRKTAGIVINEAGPSSKKLDLRLQSSTTAASGQEDEDSSEYETDTDEEESQPAPAKPVFCKPGAPAPPAQQQESGSSEYETDSEEESDSEEEANPPPLLKPVFVPKRARTTITTSAADNVQTEEDAEAKAEQAAAARRKEAHDLAAATIQRQLAEKQHEETHRTDVDDTDGLDPAAEFEAWRERELARLRRDHEALLAKRAEQAEIDAFKALPEAEKERLGRERAAQQRAEKKEQRGQPAFLQKYYHKGSFFQDMDILKRDYTEKTTRDVDVSQLPKMMQVRGFGTKGRSKWTHLANEDTSKSAMKLDGVAGGRGCFNCGGPHLRKDCPGSNGDGASGSGANASRTGEHSRKWGEAADDAKERRSERDRSRSPRRESSRDHHSSRSSRDRHADEPSRRDRDSHRHSSRDDRDHRRHSSRRDDEHDRHRSRRDDDEKRHRDSHRSHRRHDSDRDRSKSDRHDSEDRRHRRHDDERDRHKRRERDDHRDSRHGDSSRHSSSRRDRGEESDRKRSRIDA